MCESLALRQGSRLRQTNAYDLPLCRVAPKTPLTTTRPRQSYSLPVLKRRLLHQRCLLPGRRCHHPKAPDHKRRLLQQRPDAAYYHKRPPVIKTNATLLQQRPDSAYYNKAPVSRAHAADHKRPLTTTPSAVNPIESPGPTRRTNTSLLQQHQRPHITTKARPYQN